MRITSSGFNGPYSFSISFPFTSVAPSAPWSSTKNPSRRW